MKKSLSLILALVMLTGLLPQFTLPARAEETEAATNGLAGKTISILGDSISTYTGVSNNAAYNASLSGGAIYYTEGKLGVYQKDTWWQQAIDTLGLELTVNNSWSGSCIFNTRSGTVGAYVDRSVQLHNAEGEEPDMIAVYLGTNDFCNYKSTLGTSADIDYVSLITETEDGYTYATPTTAAEAYAIMLHKAAVRYPDSEIYCFTLLPQRISNTNVELLEQFNQTLLEIAEHFGAYGVDLYHDSGIKYDDNFATYVADNSLHPGPAGMDAITGCFISSILENSKYVATDVHSITYDLDNVIVDQGTAYAIMDGDTFSCTLTAPVGYDLSVTVTMGGTDITASSYANGKITISSVTADIAIAAAAALPVKDAENYRWEFDGSDLVSVSIGNNTPNALTRLAGSITDGVHSGSRFQMSENVVLYHDRPWTIEWKSEGTWTDTTDGALLFAGATTSSNADTPYIYRRHQSDFIAIGVYTGGRYHNFGVALRTSGIDATIDHVYRMENRVAADSTNMVYLYVDGVEIGPMNHHWIGDTDQNETIDWVNGRDFVFSYMGTTPHTIGNCSINYIQVIECVHTYQNSTCTAPTCTEQGYTTYTCTVCGDSYVDDYVDALGHDYKAVVTAPTCTEKGYTTYTCECGDSYRTPWLVETAYKGMTIACVGDSITAAVGVTKDENDYVTLLAEQLEMDYIRLGVSGTTLCTGGSRTCNITRLTEAYLDGADIVTIAMGINDFDAAGAGYYELGDINSTDSSTIYGAARMWCERIAELRKTDSLKDTQFYFLTPVICSRNNSVTSARDWDQSKNNIHGYTLRDLCNAIIEVAELYDVAVIDLNLLSGMYYVDAEDNNTAVFGGDGVHPGSTGHAMMANAIANALLQNDLRDDHTHTFGSWITTTWPSCFAGEQQRVCTICSATESRTQEQHNYCASVTAPTCTEKGYTTHTCTRCGDSYADTYVDVLGHKTELKNAKEATCTEDGYTGDEICTVCGGTVKQGKEIPTLGHDYKTVVTAPTCTEKGEETRTCSVCGVTETRTVDALGHNYESKVTAPTCTEKGYTTHTCTRCGDSYVDSYVPAKGHSFGSWTTTKAPTCTATGTERRDCANCDHYETRTVNALGHTEVLDAAVEPTCTASGLTEGKHCSVCGEVLVPQQTIVAKGHSFGAWVVTKPATEDSEGAKERICSACSLKETASIPKLDHVHDYDSVVTDPTCTEQGFTTHTCRCGDSYVDSYVGLAE